MSLLFQLGRFAEAREAVRTAPPGARPSLIVSLADSEADPLETARAFRASAARYVSPSHPAHANDRNPERRLRIGYLSGDFREHSMASFIGPVLTAHDRAADEAWCYYNDGTIDAATAELRARADQFKLVRMLSDEQLDKLVRDDEIDILVDLSGATGGHRLGLLGRKPAPIQVCAIGYPAAVDAYITDPYCDPPGLTEALYDEELVRLPATFQCFEPHVKAPFIEPLPALRLGHVTFASFHSYWKLSEATIDAWARILAAVPDSRILFKSTASPDSALREVLQGRFARRGIPAARLSFAEFLPSRAEGLSAYRDVDISLDAFPFNGATTTCESLWMGVPVVTLAGTTHVGRVGVSVLTNAGLPELVAPDVDDYVRIAVELAGDIPRLGGLRGALRQRLRESRLMDAAAYARDLEDAYRTLWRRWCARAQ